MRALIIQISENCWKHVHKDGNIFYHKTSNPESDIHREDGPAIEWKDGVNEWYFHGQHIPVKSQTKFEEYLATYEVKPRVIKKEVSDKDPVFIFRMEFNYSCESKNDLSEEKMIEAFREQLKKAL